LAPLIDADVAYWTRYRDAPATDFQPSEIALVLVLSTFRLEGVESLVAA